MQLSPGFLERSPEEAARLLCLELLREADQALGRLERNEDPEALHDFRVALRRLRSLASAYRPYLKGSMRKKLRARLKELASSTNTSRDAEVQHDWLAREAPALEPQARASADRLRERLADEISKMPGAHALRATFDPLHAALEKSLARVRLHLGEDRPTFLSATGRLLEGQGEAMRDSLAAVKSAEDGEELHRARIEAKRLRYLFEPLQNDVPGVRSLVKRMKSLQDVLGELQDTRVLTATISQELERSAIEAAHRLRDLALQDSEPGDAPRVASADPGLLALLRVQRERRERRYTQLERSWLSVASALFFESVADLASRLKADREPSGRRRFLLASIPEAARWGEPRSILWGYLPGSRIRERIEAVRWGRKVSYGRVIAVQGGPAIEERLTEAVFQKLWPLTLEMRLERLRYMVRDAGRQWTIESFPGRDLILAEAELDASAGLPSWLAPCVIREVTGMKKYEAETLVRLEVKDEARSAPERRFGPPAEAQ